MPWRERRRGLSRMLLVAIIAWSIFAVGGVYLWAGVPLILAAAILAMLARPRVAGASDTRPLDVALLATLALAALQLCPMPRGLQSALSPQYERVLRSLLLVPSARQWRPLSLDPAATGYALALVAAALLVFWSARHICGRGGARGVAWSVAMVGLLATLTAILQSAGDPTLVYGVWRPVDAGARPFGPFVNRNHFATWVLLAIPLALGAAAASAAARRPGRGLASQIGAVVSALGRRSGWAGVCAATMTLGLVASSSRAGLLAAAAGLVTWFVLARRRASRGAHALALAGTLALAAVLLSSVPVQPLLSRAEETLALGAGERPLIWRDTVDTVRAFPLTGAGLGAFPTAMLTFQTGDRRAFSNQAHNQYLQVAAEGGLLVVLPLLVVVVLFARLVAIRLAADLSPTIWIRMGAVSGIVAVAVQSLWETGLRMPANGVLFAVAAAIAVHRPGTVRLDGPGRPVASTARFE